MTEQELNLLKQIQKENKKQYLEAKEVLEQKKAVQLYIQCLKILEADNQLQKYLDTLEVGTDGTIFAPTDHHKDKAFKNTHFGLGQILSFAFDLLRKESNKDIGYYQISFENLLTYIENAKEVLNKMEYITGDRLIENEWNLDLYENPKNYSIVNLSLILPITTEELHINYDAKGIYIDENCFIAYDTGKRTNQLKTLTPREKEAFYGLGAKKALNIEPQKVKIKEKISKIIK